MNIVRNIVRSGPRFGIVGFLLMLVTCWQGGPFQKLWAEDGVAPVALDQRRELFLDDLLIDRMENCRLELHSPQEKEIVFTFDAPWEGIYSGYITVLQDGGRFRMYYRGMPRASHDFDTEVTCMAESEDGIHWTRPKLGLYEVQGTKENNVVLARHVACHNFAPFIDRRPDCPPDARYKALGGNEKGLVAFASSDGIHWRQLQEAPVFTEGAFDSQNNAFWSEVEQQYVLYFRSWPQGVRWISRTTSKDFFHWEKPVDLEAGGLPMEHLYTGQIVPYPRAPHLYLGFPTRFLPGRRVLTQEQMEQIGTPPWYLNDSTDILLALTRGGTHFRRWPEAFLRPGRDLRNWTSRANYAVQGIFEVGEEIWFYVQHHCGYPSSHVRRYSIRPDGFVSVRAGRNGGVLLTKPITFTGRELRINFSTAAAGGLRVELQNARGEPIPGFTLDDCPEIVGDQLDHPVRWNSGGNLESLIGQPVRLRFYLRDADLFALRFTSEN